MTWSCICSQNLGTESFLPWGSYIMVSKLHTRLSLWWKTIFIGWKCTHVMVLHLQWCIMPCEAWLKSSDLFYMTHLPCSKATQAKVKLKPKSCCSCMRNLQRGLCLCEVLPVYACLLHFFPPPLTVARDTGNMQHFNHLGYTHFYSLQCIYTNKTLLSCSHQMTEALYNMKSA